MMEWNKARENLNFISVVLIVVLVFSIYNYSKRYETCVYPALYRNQTLVLDAGHGGEDGGAVSVTGTNESEINLKIALKTDQMCGFYGVSDCMVRTDDRSLKDSSADTLAEMKRSDLCNRVTLVEGMPNAVLISIHQNFFPEGKNQGTQIFYAPTPQSQEWACYGQELFRKNLNPDNHRQATLIPESVYLMNHISCPGFLLECGFISDREEAELLETDSYQCRIAATALSCYMTYSF